ncbi:hypothetical protein [Sinorhizobium meliloti]|uniref:hypothetical protein n=1 Tax=Rhizobium meliloti TaxID=382 RepID=UPI00186592CF|nr:hypothetical protein [Sinorhizobium meliloti]
MVDPVEDFIRYQGPCLTSAVSDHLVQNLGLTPAAARKRVSRASGEVRRLAYITFPRKARYVYLEKQFGSPEYWSNLVDADFAPSQNEPDLQIARGEKSRSRRGRPCG